MWPALFLLAGACAPQGGIGEGVDRTWDGDFLINQIIIDCDGFYAWTYDVQTLGWGKVVTVDVAVREFGTLVWAEHHEIPEVDYGDDWAHHTLEIHQEDDEANYADSQSTIINCDAKTFVTYGFAAWRQDGDMQECIAWGADPEGEFPDCESWGTASH